MRADGRVVPRLPLAVLLRVTQHGSVEVAVELLKARLPLAVLYKKDLKSVFLRTTGLFVCVKIYCCR